MTINFNTAPYHDDYDEAKDFHRILFKPGFAVQARELTQLQTILQKQISRFGDHVFKDGSLVIPGATYVHKNYNYVKIEAAYNNLAVNVNNFIDREIKGQTSGVRAKVLKVTTASLSDPATLYVKYLDSGSNFTSSSFQTGEILLTDDGGTTYGATIFPTNPVGKSIAVSIDDGVYYVKGNFVRVAANTIIPSKYSDRPNSRIGLNIVETIVSKDDDESLLDPAISTYNYFAPGADRYKISLILDSRDISNTTSSDTFIELMRLEEGELVSRTVGPGYNILGDELAKRTYDESGDYVVSPFTLNFIEHLKSNVSLSPDGVLSASGGGNSMLGVAVISPGKAYVRGYKVEQESKKFISFPKPRDYSTITDAIIRTPIGNYIEVSNIHSIPDFTTDLKTVTLYDRYPNTKALVSGNIVGNARIRGFEYSSGNIMISSGKGRAFLFDIRMEGGKTFSRDVKSLSTTATTSASPVYTSNNFVADVVPEYITLRGLGNTSSNANMVQGINTFYTTDLKVGDYISLSGNVLKNYRINNIISPSNLTLDAAVEFSGNNQTIYLHKANLLESSYSTYIFPVSSEYSVIKDFADVTYRVRRVIGGTLTGSSFTITAGSDESFASITDGNFFAVIGSGSSKGNIIRISSSMVTQNTVRNWTIDFNTYGLSGNDIIVYSTIIKTPLDSTVKTKTSTSTFIDITTETETNTGVISLNYADVYELTNVKMSSNLFGNAYTTNSETDITDYFTLDTGQRSTYYDVSKIVKKPGFPKISNPIRIHFKYYSHSSGEFFRADSYPDYSNIPTFVDNGITYNLRDCLDYRPRISNTGNSFIGTGSVVNEFIDNDNDFQSDISFYLPRIDKVVVTQTGNVVYKTGVSSLSPVEPATPDQSMPIYIVNVPAYLFDVKNDPTIIPVYQKRYTMRDIGKLETRIKNLEYYTSLSLLELDTALFSIKDSFGLDRFKNGFIVDSFTGHSVGDVYNPDYNISVDIQKGELRPGVITKNIGLREWSVLDDDRTSNGYALTNQAITLGYTEELLISSSAASKDESVNPFNVYVFTGSMKLSPPGDTWYDETEKPIVYNNPDGTYDSLIPDSVMEKTYGSIWNSWKNLWGQSNEDLIQSTSQGVVLTESNVTGGATSAVLPFMRRAEIKFTATGMKPNTKMYVFFNNYNFTDYCTANTSNINGSFLTQDTGNIFSDRFGTVEGYLKYDPVTSGISISTGYIPLVVTDSSTNSTNKESFAIATFSSSGTLNKKIIPVARAVDINTVNNWSGGGDDYVNNYDGSLAARASRAYGGSTEKYESILRSKGISDADVANYGPGNGSNASDYSEVYNHGISNATGLQTDTNGNYVNLWSSGAVQSMIDYAQDNLTADQRDYIGGCYNSIVQITNDRFNDPNNKWSDAEIKFGQGWVAAGNSPTDVAGVVAAFAAASVLGYARDDKAGEDKVGR